MLISQSNLRYNKQKGLIFKVIEICNIGMPDKDFLKNFCCFWFWNIFKKNSNCITVNKIGDQWLNDCLAILAHFQQIDERMFSL
jgi:hypothetical protein